MHFLLATFFILTLSPRALAQSSETAIIQQMQQLQNQGPADTRIADYFEKLKAAPRDPEIHFQLGEIYLERSLFELAIAAFRRALEFQSSFPKAHVGLSKVFRKKGLKALELQEMAAAVAQSPSDPQLRLALGVLYMEPENFDYNQAKKQYKELKKLQSPLADELGAKMGIQ